MPADMQMISYAQNYEDVVLARVFDGTARGFYIDVGANHPEHDSLTKHFSDRGWCGVNVEPGRFYPALVAARPRDVNLNAAVSNRRGTMTFYEGASAGLAGVISEVPELLRWIVGERTARAVQAITLADIFREHVGSTTVDFLSVDVEGHEKAVLEGNDWRANRPRVVVLEATEPGTSTPSHAGWEPLLLNADYLFAYFDGLNRFYVRREDGQLMNRFGPPCLFDNFITAEVAALRAGNATVCGAIRERDHLAQQVHSLQKELAARDRLVAEIGPRSLRAGLWLARHLTRLKRSVARRAA